MFWHNGDLHMVFGDTFGEGGLHHGGRNWRSNVMARLAQPIPEEGLCIESMVTGPDGAAKELIPSAKIDGVEMTVVPTHGVSVDGRMFLHFMSVRTWGNGTGLWEVGHAGFAFSDDSGQNWTIPEDAVWTGGTGFEQVAFVQEQPYVYTFGIPAGRFGGVRLRRSQADRLLDLSAHEYWDGDAWVADPAAATQIVPPPVGEFSVAWNTVYQQWMMLYLNLQRRAVVLRTAPELTGPWSDEQVVLTARDYPGLYAPYIVPVSNIGDDVYFTLSLWEPYNVFLVRMRLEGTPADPLITVGDTDA
jgi:hypothetical protein